MKCVSDSVQILEDNVNFVPRFLRIHKARTGKHWDWDEHLNTEIEMVLICQGISQNIVNNVKFSASDGDLYFVLTNQLHCEDILTSHLDYYLLRFELLDSFGDSIGFIPQGLSKKQCIKNFKGQCIDYFEKILQLSWMDDSRSEAKIEELILHLSQLVKSEFLKQESSESSDRFVPPQNALALKAIEYLNNRVLTNISVKELAEHCCVTPSHLTHVFKDSMGVAPIKYHQQLRMDRAKHFLADSSFCIYQVAHEVGFEDQFYFSRLFKKIIGLSPTQYRSQIKSVQL